VTVGVLVGFGVLFGVLVTVGVGVGFCVLLGVLVTVGVDVGLIIGHLPSIQGPTSTEVTYEDAVNAFGDIQRGSELLLSIVV
jgi:hypothetical protein